MLVYFTLHFRSLVATKNVHSKRTYSLSSLLDNDFIYEFGNRSIYSDIRNHKVVIPNSERKCHVSSWLDEDGNNVGVKST